MICILSLTGCDDKDIEPRDAIKSLLTTEEYEITLSDENGQVVTIKNTKMDIIVNRLKNGDAEMIVDDDHSVWKWKQASYQISQNGNDIEIIVIDNPPKEPLKFQNDEQ